MILTEKELDIVRRDGLVSINSKRYAICDTCKQVVCVNKRFFGDLHVCLTEEEQIQQLHSQQRDSYFSRKDI